MTTIWEKTCEALETLDVPFAANRYQADSENVYPDTFLVYQQISSAPDQFADDEETERSYRMQVTVFSRDGLINLPDVDGAMKAAGFTKGGVVEIPLDAETGHFGLATDFFYSESED